jgi:hypothetical protein
MRAWWRQLVNSFRKPGQLFDQVNSKQALAGWAAAAEQH